MQCPTSTTIEPENICQPGHSSSSEPSAQSSRPSHLWLSWMHVWSMQVNSESAHGVDIGGDVTAPSAGDIASFRCHRWVRSPLSSLVTLTIIISTLATGHLLGWSGELEYFPTFKDPQMVSTSCPNATANSLYSSISKVEYFLKPLVLLDLPGHFCSDY